MQLFCAGAVRYAGLLMFLLMLSACSSMANRADNDIPTAAQEAAESLPSGEFEKRFYLGISAGGSKLSPRSNGSGYSLDDGQSSALELRAGVDVSERFSVEGHASDFGEATIKPQGSISYSEYGVSGLIYLSRNNENLHNRKGLLGFLRVGAGLLNNSAKGVSYEQVNGIHLLLGVGAEYAFKNGFSLRGEVVSYEADLQAYQVGLKYRFGKRSEETAQPASAPVVSAESSTENAPVEPPVATPIVTSPAPEELVELQPPDADRDGVLDTQDACLGTSAGTVVDERGCRKLSGVLEGVNFNPNSATFRSEAEQILQDVVATLKALTEARAELAAHTDSQGSEQSNLRLSRQRVISVANYLIKHGIERHRLAAKAYGESRPIADNSTAQGREKNRRVEIRLLN